MTLSNWLGLALAGLVGSVSPLQAKEPGLSPEQLEPGYADGGFGAIWLMVRYRWHRGWDPAGRFKRLP